MPVCNICGSQKFGFGPGGRVSVTGKHPKCLNCFSLERHRALRKVYVQLLDSLPFHQMSALLISPDKAIEPRWFKSFEVSVYGDSNSIDIQNINKPDKSYDVVICNHVLEHVENDTKALQELMRIVSDFGFLQLSVSDPVRRPKTTDWGYPKLEQHGHYRLYGKDIELKFLQIFSLDIYQSKIFSVDPVTGMSDVYFFFTRSSSVATAIEKQVKQNNLIPEVIDFQIGGNAKNYQTHGWYRPENLGTWSVAGDATLAISVSDIDQKDKLAAGLNLSIIARAFVPPEPSQTSVQLLCNQQLIHEWNFVVGDSFKKLSAFVPVELLLQEEVLEMMFRSPSLKSPKELGISPDTRRLGICIKEIKLSKREIENKFGFIKVKDDVAKNCILHIGTEKTGTTAIQNFLYLNKDRLSSQGFFIPQSLGIKNNKYLALLSYEENKIDDITKSLNIFTLNESKKQRILLTQKIEQEIKSEQYIHTVIFSSEHLQSRLVKESEMERLHDVIKNLNLQVTKIIIYIRNPIELAVSLVSTAIKVGRSLSCEIPSPNNHYLKNLCDHKATIERWSKQFGSDKIVVRLYDPEKFYQKSLLADFCLAANITYDTKFLQLSKPYNPSLDWLGMNLLSRINIKIPRYDDKGYFNHIRANLVQFIERYCSNGLSSLSPNPSMVAAYKEAFQVSNEWVRQNFFPNQRSLFRDYVYPQSKTLDIDSNSIDIIAELIADIWMSKQKTILNLEEELKILRKSFKPEVCLMPKVINFKIGGNAKNYQTHGWYRPENLGTWSVAGDATLAISLSDINQKDKLAAGLNLSIIARAFVPPEPSQTSVQLLCNQQLIHEWNFVVGDSFKKLSAFIPAELLLQEETLEMMFRSPSYKSPKELGISPDTRRLGICIKEIKLIV